MPAQGSDKGEPKAPAESSFKKAVNVFEGLLSVEEQGNARETPAPSKESKAKAVTAPPPETEEPEPVSEPTETVEDTPKVPEAIEEGAEVEAEEQETEAEPETEPKVQTFKVRVDGKDVEVTLDELLGGYSRTSDYTRKTQALADQRKTVEADAATVREQRAQYAELLDNAKQALDTIVPKEPNWTQLKSKATPEEFAATWEAWQQFKTRRESITREQERLAREESDDRMKRLREGVSAEYEKLVAALPDWKDEAKAKTEREALVTYVRGLGVTDEEIGAVTDHRLVLLIRKAMLWDQLQGKRSSIEAKVAAKPKIKPAEPGSPGDKPKPPSEKKRALSQLAKSGSVKDAAKAFEHFID